MIINDSVLVPEIFSHTRYVVVEYVQVEMYSNYCKSNILLWKFNKKKYIRTEWMKIWHGNVSEEEV